MASIQLAVLLLAPLVHDLLCLQSTCSLYSLGRATYCTFGTWKLWYDPLTAAPLHSASLPTALPFELLFNIFLRLWSNCDLSSLSGAIYCAIGQWHLDGTTLPITRLQVFLHTHPPTFLGVSHEPVDMTFHLLVNV